jgi:Flp pilus assembly protein CpaB
MEAVQKRPTSEGLRRYLATRRGAVTAAIVAAILAGVVLVAFLEKYKTNVKNDTRGVPVLVAQRLIPAGTSGDVASADGYFKPGSIAQKDIKVGALATGAAVSGAVATHDIYPGQQITTADFAVGGDALRGKLSGTQRAIALSLDTQHGMIGTIRAGDHVDILFGNGSSGGGIIKTLLQNVLVLQAPGTTGSAALGDSAPSPSGMIVEVSDRDAAKLAFAQDNGRLWFTLRPVVGAKQNPPVSVNLATVEGGH